MKTIIANSNDPLLLTVEKMNQVSDDKNEIKKMKEIPFHQGQFSIGDKYLDNNIIEKSSINESKKVQILIRSDLESNIVLIDPDCNIKELKNVIYEKTGILPNNQTLTYRHQKLEDMYKLTDYSIQKFSSIYAFDINIK